jgi:hypothetical protein
LGRIRNDRGAVSALAARAAVGELGAVARPSAAAGAAPTTTNPTPQIRVLTPVIPTFLSKIVDDLRTKQ